MVVKFIQEIDDEMDQLEKEFEDTLDLASQGDVDAMYKVSKYYYEGVAVDADYELSFSWLKKAAEKLWNDAPQVIGILRPKGDDDNA